MASGRSSKHQIRRTLHPTRCQRPLSPVGSGFDLLVVHFEGRAVRRNVSATFPVRHPLTKILTASVIVFPLLGVLGRRLRGTINENFAPGSLFASTRFATHSLTQHGADARTPAPYPRFALLLLASGKKSSNKNLDVVIRTEFLVQYLKR